MQVEIGKIYEGTVKNITKYGAFVELQMPEEEKVMGMVHISEISRSYVNEIRDFVTEGQSVRVKVIGTNPQGKISLSMKQAEENKSTAADAVTLTTLPAENAAASRSAETVTDSSPVSTAPDWPAARQTTGSYVSLPRYWVCSS